MAHTLDPRYAEYVLTHVPDGVEVTTPHGIDRLPLVPNFTLCVAREQGWPIQVGGERFLQLGWGGRRNHTVDFDAQMGWRINHLGHTGTIMHNNRALDGRARASALADGDRIVPAQGLVFTFRLLPKLHSLAERLIQSSVVNILQQATTILPDTGTRDHFDVGYDWYDALISSQKTPAGQVLTDWVLDHIADAEEAKHCTLQLLARHSIPSPRQSRPSR